MNNLHFVQTSSEDRRIGHDAIPIMTDTGRSTSDTAGVEEALAAMGRNIKYPVTVTLRMAGAVGGKSRVVHAQQNFIDRADFKSRLWHAVIAALPDNTPLHFRGADFNGSYHTPMYQEVFDGLVQTAIRMSNGRNAKFHQADKE